MRPADVVYAPAVGSTTATVTVSGFISSSLLVELMLGIAFGIVLLGAGLGSTPPWALEWPVVAFVYERRAGLIFAGLGIALALVAFALTGWSA